MKIIFSSLCLALLASTLRAQSPPQGLVLDQRWQSPLQGGSDTLKDLGALLSPFAKPSPSLAPAPGIKIYEEISYLMPVEDAKKLLKLDQRQAVKNKVLCPGFPKDSLLYHAFDGIFEGHFNKLVLVTDRMDQVVAVELIAEVPKRDQVDAPYSPTDWHMYNFVLSRTKATRRLWIDHKCHFQEDGRWQEYRPTFTSSQPKAEVQVLRIDSLLMDPGKREGYRTSDWKPLEAARLYLPKPLMEVILHCVNAGGR